MSPLAALLTGGASRRMLGRPKGLLPGVDGVPLALRAARIFEHMEIPYFAVGNRPHYEGLGLPVIKDTRPGEGPIAGLEAALLEATRRGHDTVLLVACDLPFFTEALLRRLLDAPSAPAIAFARGGHLEPLLARYDVAVLPQVQARLDRAERAMQPLLRAVGALVAPLAPAEEGLLVDWDTPDAITAPGKPDR